MKDNKQKHLALVWIAAVFLIAVNLGVWLAAGHGAIAPIANPVLWTAFAVLNVVSLVWVISLLGLHPLIVTLSYVTGGFLAFKGVEGISGINIAEITTAGATYGAFGAIVVGNLTTKVRLAFFSKRQVPLLFIIVVLLVLDAVLSSEITNAEGSILLNAMVFPFVLAGVTVGLVWSLFNRYGISSKVSLTHGAAAVAHPEVENEESEEPSEPAELNTLKIEIPDHVEEEEDVDAVAAAIEEVEIPEIAEPPVEEPIKPIVAEEEKEEDFFPLEIDRGDDDHLVREEIYSAEAAADADLPEEDPFSVGEFDVNLYASIIDEIDPAEAVMIEEPAVSLITDLKETAAAEPPVQPPVQPPVAEKKPPEAVPEEQTEPGPGRGKRSDDWLSGHLDLLNKLK
jgi:hypothetical protein